MDAGPPRIVEPLLDDAAPDGVAVEMQGPPYTPLRPRRMSLMTHTLARAAKKGTAFPAFAKVPDFPICTFFFMDEAPNDVDLIETLKKLMSIDRLRCTVMGEKTFEWEVVADMEQKLASHVTRAQVSSEKELRAKMDALILTPLDASRPLWDVTVVTLAPNATWTDSPAGPGRKPPMVCVRLSHTIGDGISLVNVLNEACVSEDGSPVRTVNFTRRPNPKVWDWSTLYNPINILTQLANLLWYILKCIYAVLRALVTPFGPHDTKTAFCDTKSKVVYSGKRTMVTCPSFKLADIREIKTQMGCTVNDVVCACLAGALHKYQVHRGDPTADRRPLVRAAVPYAFPRKNPAELTNSWTFVSLPFYLGPMDIKDRLAKTKRRCDDMKRSPEAHVIAGINTVAGKLLGAKFQSQTIYDFMSRHSMVFTNVPGPTAPVVLFGQKVNDFLFGMGNLVNQVSVISYDGTMTLSLVVDPDAVPDAHLIGKFFQEELDNLCAKLI